MHGPAEPFALLDDCTATPGQPCSRLYTGFVREHRCERKGERNRGEEVALMDARWEDEEGDRDQGEGGDRSGALVVSCRPPCRGDCHEEQQCADK